MIGPSIRHLRYFDALARNGHFGRAAQECSVSQPALSVQVKELEDIIGAPLVERSLRKIQLTALGKEFARRVGDILRAVDELGDVARAFQRPLVGRLRLGVIPTIAPYLLPAIIKELSRRYAGLDILPRETVTHRLIDDLAQSRLEAAIVALPISEPSLSEFEVLHEDFVLVRSLEDAHKPVPDRQQLQAMRLLLLEEGHCFRDQALAFCSLTQASGRELMEGSSLSTLVQMVGAGIGVTLIPSMAVPLETRSAAVSVARLAPPGPSRRIGMVWRKTNPLAGELEQIAGVVRDLAQDLVPAA